MIKVRSLSEVLRNDTVSSRARAFLSPLRGARDRIIFFEEDRETATRRPRDEKRKKTNNTEKDCAEAYIHTHARAYLLNHGYFYSYCFIVI
jgi:hypothetical protein